MTSKIQVSSRGCSRAYVLCVLWRCLDHVRKCWHNNIPVSSPFKREDIMQWIIEAESDALDIDFQKTIGVPDFNPRDRQTYWNRHDQFNLWWKNNVERRDKFEALVRDAVKSVRDAKTGSRALYCRQAIALSVNIKNHFHRIKNDQEDTDVVFQLNFPVMMPSRLPTEAIQLPNRTVWRDFDRYLHYVLSMGENRIHSNIPIFRVDSFAYSADDLSVPLPPSSAMVNGLRQTYSSSSVGLISSSKRRSSRRKAPPMDDAIDDDGDDNLSDLAILADSNARFLRSNRSPSTFPLCHEDSMRLKRGRRVDNSGQTPVDDAYQLDQTAAGNDELTVNECSATYSHLGSKRRRGEEDAGIIVVRRRSGRDPVMLSRSDNGEYTTYSADFNDFGDLIDFKEYDCLEILDQEATSNGSVSGSTVIVADTQEEDSTSVNANFVNSSNTGKVLPYLNLSLPVGVKAELNVHVCSGDSVSSLLTTSANSSEGFDQSLHSACTSLPSSCSTSCHGDSGYLLAGQGTVTGAGAATATPTNPFQSIKHPIISPRDGKVFFPTRPVSGSLDSAIAQESTEGRHYAQIPHTFACQTDPSSIGLMMNASSSEHSALDESFCSSSVLSAVASDPPFQLNYNHGCVSLDESDRALFLEYLRTPTPSEG